MKCVCGAFLNEIDTHCSLCTRVNPLANPLQQLKLQEVVEKYGIDKKALLESDDILDFVELIGDNCIIYNDGIVDPFEYPKDLVSALEGECDSFNTKMSETYDEIHFIIWKGKLAKFEIVDKIEFFEAETQIKFDDAVGSDKINGCDYIMTLRDCPRTVLRFYEPEKLAEWIHKNGDEDIAMIFIKQKYHEWTIQEVFKLEGLELEIKTEVPF